MAGLSGEPYITHPIAVASIVYSMKLDHHSIMAALLHDVLEDTQVSREDMVEAFGEEVTHIVDGVSKLSHLRFRSKQEAQAESLTCELWERFEPTNNAALVKRL